MDNYPIHLAIQKYGEEAFTVEILEWTEDYDNREAYYIKTLNSLSPNGYNILEGGHSPIMYGEEHPRNTVSNEALDTIIQKLQESELTYGKIAEIVGVTEKVVSDINHGITHKRDNLNYPIRKNFQRKDRLQKTDVEEIKRLLRETNLSYSEIGELFGCTKSNIYHINSGRTYKEDIEYPIRKR